ncbi:Panacea domain-containing protein [Alloscardovia venturai]|uniref:Panacea domain-containing protein n=1 Tax=Alloscardovia venturai TaxID=1769421 RepID=A0ABW2Y7P0_9BIFI
MMVTALDVANTFIMRHSDLYLSNLSLNKLVYFAQVESLRLTGKPLFESEIQAWQYGPVEPDVYRAFSHHKTAYLTPAGVVKNDEQVNRIVDHVADKYGFLTAFDLVDYSHRDGGAWKNVYDGTRNKTITIKDILDSDDVVSYPTLEGTMTQDMHDIYNKYRNTFRLLGDA